MQSVLRFVTRSFLVVAAAAPLAACSAAPTESSSTDEGESALGEATRVGDWGMTLQLCKTTPLPGAFGACPAGQTIAGDTIPVPGPAGRGRTYLVAAVSKRFGLSWNRRYVKTIRIEGKGVHVESHGPINSPFAWAFDDTLPAGAYEVSVVSALRADASRPGSTEGFDREDVFPVNVGIAQAGGGQTPSACLPAFNKYCTAAGLFCAAEPNTFLVAPDVALAGNVPLVRCRSAGCAVSATACDVATGVTGAACYFAAPGTDDACYPVRPAKCPGCG
jgi:hypothetical protein